MRSLRKESMAEREIRGLLAASRISRRTYVSVTNNEETGGFRICARCVRKAWIIGGLYYAS